MIWALPIFCFFLLSSMDQLNWPLFIFKARASHLIAAPLALVLVREMDRRWVAVALFILVSMSISMLGSCNQMACMGYLLLFAFNFVCYFGVSANLFRLFCAATIWKWYRYSFYCVGCYAWLQVAASIVGYGLPGALQWKLGLARGMGFSYEPGYYALYMTPFTAFCMAQFFQGKGSWKEMLLANLFLWVSTSAGIVYSYLFLLAFITLFRLFGLWNGSLWKVLSKCALAGGLILGVLYLLNPDLLEQTFLKFFYGEGAYHFSYRERKMWLWRYWYLFLQYPWVGSGLGAGPWAIVNEWLGCINPSDRSVVQHFAPMNVTTEVLAGLGLLGAVGFGAFLYLLGELFYKTLQRVQASERVVWVSCTIAFLTTMMTLQFNQSIMRPYMWIMVGLFYGYGKQLQEKHAYCR